VLSVLSRPLGVGKETRNMEENDLREFWGRKSSVRSMQGRRSSSPAAKPFLLINAWIFDVPKIKKNVINVVIALITVLNHHRCHHYQSNVELT